MSTTTTETTVATTTALPPIEEVADVQATDGSKIADRKNYLAGFERLGESLVAHVGAMLAAGQASRMGAEASLAIRLSIIRGDNGAPDFAGQTAAYNLAFRTYLDNFSRTATVLGADGKPQPITTDQVEKYRSAVRRYMSDTGMLRAAEAEYVARNDSEVSTKAADVRKLVAARSEVPEDVKKGMERLHATQVAKDGKTRLNGFQKTDVPATFGPPAKTSGGGGGAGNTGGTTPARAWGLIRADIEAGKLAPDVVADELHHLLTLALFQVSGPIGERVPKAAAGRKKALDTYGAAERLIHSFLAALEGSGKKDAMAEHAWSEQ